jgi:hypothetical protein
MKSEIWLVLGDNGKGNSGNGIYGIYPTEALATRRLKALEDAWNKGEDGCEFMWVDMVEVGAEGADCDIAVCG